MQDLYLVLGVSRLAGQAEIEAAYRARIEEALAAGGQETEARMAALREAYGVLADPAAREIYDQSLRFSVVRASEPAALRGDLGAFPEPSLAHEEPEQPRIPWFWIGVAAVAIAGSLAYKANVTRQQEKARAQQEREIQQRALQAEEENRKKAEEARAAEEARQARLASERLEQANRDASEQALREASRRADTEERETEWRRQREADQAAEKQRQEEYRRQQEQEEIERQLERYRNELRRPPRY